MSTKETVRVTAEHIERGVPQLPDACPIALAIRAQHPEASVEVYRTGALLDRGSVGPTLVSDMPPTARRFVDEFDNQDDPVEPIEFELTWRNLSEVTR